LASADLDAIQWSQDCGKAIQLVNTSTL